MPLLAGTVIDTARDRHAAFTKERHPNKAALRELSAYAKSLHGKILQIDPDVLRVDVVTALPLAVFDDGIALPANTQYVAEAVARFPATSSRTPFPITIIDSAARNALNAPRGAAWQVGNVLYLRSPDTLWRDFDAIALAVVTLPGDLADLTDNLALPDAANFACIERLASFFAGREAEETESKISTQRFDAKAEKAETEYLNTVRAALTGKSFFTQDVWHP